MKHSGLWRAQYLGSRKRGQQLFQSQEVTPGGNQRSYSFIMHGLVSCLRGKDGIGIGEAR